MRHIHDKELKGHCLLFDGPLDLVQHAKAACEAPDCPTPFKGEPVTNYPGRVGKGWKKFEDFLHSPWPEAFKRVEWVQDKVMKEHMPTPKSMKRKARWNDVDGEVDIDRAMTGEFDFYRKVQREKVTGPTHIALVTNLDSSANVNPSGLFFRSTAAIAATDILENLGYSVEIWVWCRGERVFPEPDSNQFVGVQVKSTGDPIDKNALCDTLSAWFTSEAIYGCFAACPIKPVSLGCPIEANESAKTIKDCGIGDWAKYLDIQEGVTAIPVPMAWGSLDSAVECAKKILQNIIYAQGN